MTKAYSWRVAAVVVVGLSMAILDTTIVSVTLPQMQKAFHTDFETITWVGSAYFLKWTRYGYSRFRSIQASIFYGCASLD
jgi:hypothetical protein